MSASSIIGYLDKSSGKIKTAYCHFYGDIGGNGKTLVSNYNNYDLAEELVNMGGMTSLGKNIYESDFFYKSPGDEPGVSVFDSFSEAVGYYDEYFYIYQDDCWQVYYKYFEDEPPCKDILKEIEICDDIGLVITFNI